MFMDFENALVYYGKISKNYSELLEKVNKIYILTGFTIEELINKLSEGYILIPPNYKNKLSDLESK